MNRVCYVYICRDEDRSPLYVGCAYDVDARLKQHNSTVWISKVSSVERLEYKSRSIALENEKRLIKELRPSHNVAENYEGSKSDYFCRLGIKEDMRMQIEAWRIEQLQEMGKVPSFSEAVRQLVEKGLLNGKNKD